MAHASLAIQKVESTAKMKAEFRYDLDKERALRALTQDHLSYINSEKLWDVTQKGKWAQRSNGGKTEYVHLFKGHALVLSQDGPLENPVVTIDTTDSDGNTISMHISATAAGLSTIGLTIGILALAVQMAVAQESVEATLAAAAGILGAEVDVEAEITLAGAAGPVGIVLAFLSIFVILGIFLGERDILAHVRYENRSTRKDVKLLKCWTWNLPDIAPATLQPLHTVAGFDTYDVAVYDHYNDRKTEGIGLSLLFQTDEGYANVCIRNDIHKDPRFGIATSKTPVEPKDFYYDLPETPLGQDCKWGSLVIKNSFDRDAFQNYHFEGIVSFSDA